MTEMRPEPYKECLSMGIQAFCWPIIWEMEKYCLGMLGCQDRQRLKSECFG